jgi:hypothetical protein
MLRGALKKGLPMLSLFYIWTCLHHKGPQLHLDLSTLQRALQLLEVSPLRGPELSLLSLYVSTLQWLVLACTLKF